MAAPQHEHGRRMAAVHLGHHRIGERLPPLVLVGCGKAHLHGQHVVEQQHPLLRPMLQKAVGGPGNAEVALKLLVDVNKAWRSEEHTSELQSLMRNSYAVFCLKKKTKNKSSIQSAQSKHIKPIPYTNSPSYFYNL